MKRILVVEDDADVREGMIEVLSSENYLVDSAENGKVALDRLLSGSPLPDLIVLDLMMPVMDGREFLAKLSGQYPEIFRAIPILIATASRHESLKTLPVVAGFITKPIEIDDLLHFVEKSMMKNPIERPPVEANPE